MSYHKKAVYNAYWNNAKYPESQDFRRLNRCNGDMDGQDCAVIPERVFSVSQSGVDFQPPALSSAHCYYQFLSDVQTAIPAINAFCFCNSDGQILPREQADSMQTQWMTLYEAAQYNNLFGKKERSRVLYP
ncbi:MAG: hypothetical protein MR636_04820 [Clostridiales bacterium]|nr:hypothetical protein [Clostridiales bacterium]